MHRSTRSPWHDAARHRHSVVREDHGDGPAGPFYRRRGGPRRRVARMVRTRPPHPPTAGATHLRRELSLAIGRQLCAVYEALCTRRTTLRGTCVPTGRATNGHSSPLTEAFASRCRSALALEGQGASAAVENVGVAVAADDRPIFTVGSAPRSCWARRASDDRCRRRHDPAFRAAACSPPPRAVYSTAGATREWRWSWDWRTIAGAPRPTP